MTHLFHYDPPAVADAGDELSIQVGLLRKVKDTFVGVRLVATPNAGKRTAWAAAKAKAEGMSAGYPDLTAIWPGGVAFLEIKARTGSLGPEQHNWLNWLTQAGFPCGCFRSVETATAFLRAHGAPMAA